MVRSSAGWLAGCVLEGHGPQSLALDSAATTPNACEEGGWQAVLPQDGPASRIWGLHPLPVAAGLGDTSMLEELLGGRADVAQTWTRERPLYLVQARQQPLHIVATRGHTAAICLLLRHRADVNAQDGTGQAALAMFAASGSSDAVRCLLEQRADIDARWGGGSTPLDISVVFGRIDVVELLIAARADLFDRPSGVTPLHDCAIFQSGHRVTQALISARADVDSRLFLSFGTSSWFIISMMSLQFYCGNRSFLTLFAHHLPGSTPLMLAVMFNLFEEASLMLHAGASLGTRNIRGADARGLAEIFGVSDVVRSLLREARPNGVRPGAECDLLTGLVCTNAAVP